MLGCVKEVSDFQAVVGFSSGLVGYLPICNICDSYTNILKETLDSEDSLKVPQLHKDWKCKAICECCH